MAMYVDPVVCNGCGACVETCPNDAIRLVSGKAVVDQDKCAACAVCADACPTHAITEEAPLVVIPEPVEPIARPPRVIVPAQRPARAPSPWLGTALAFVGREIVPRLLDVLEKRLLSPAQSPAAYISSTSKEDPSARRAIRQTDGQKVRGPKRRRRRHQRNHLNSRNERR